MTIKFDQRTATLIPKRRERSLGYGFVAFATKAGADKALAEFDQKVLGDREISVQAAILKTDEELKAKRAAARKTRRTKDSRPRSTSRKADEVCFLVQSLISKQVNESRKETAKEPVPRSEPRKPRQTSRAARTTEKPPADSSVKPPAHKVEDFDSSRTLYLGNLPWTVTETELDSIFSEYQFTKSLVPRFGYNYSRSKGYGLVEFSDRNVMLTVMKDVDSVSIDGRQLVIKEAKPPRAQ